MQPSHEAAEHEAQELLPATPLVEPLPVLLTAVKADSRFRASGCPQDGHTAPSPAWLNRHRRSNSYPHLPHTYSYRGTFSPCVSLLV